MNGNEVPEVSSRPLKMRSQAEVKAQYEVKIKKYNELMQAQGDHREQRMELYAEIKLLGWVLRKKEKEVIDDLGSHHIIVRASLLARCGVSFLLKSDNRKTLLARQLVVGDCFFIELATLRSHCAIYAEPLLHVWDVAVHNRSRLCAHLFVSVTEVHHVNAAIVEYRKSTKLPLGQFQPRVQSEVS